MPTLDIFTVVSILMAFVSLRVLVTTVRVRSQLFDADFTRTDRQRLMEIAIFLLLPISVLFHEGGHALFIKAFGGQITGFGYFLFLGYVEHVGNYTLAQIFWIALAGNLVSLLLGLLALAVPLLRPMRPSINYLLLAFAGIDLANTLIFYPLLDFAGNIEGDWSQIYNSRTPVLSGVTAGIHAALLLVGVIAWRSDWGRALYARRTGLPVGAIRRVTRVQAAGELLAVAERLSAGWQHPLRVVADAQSEAAGVTLHWISGGYRRVVGAYAVTEGWRHIELHGGIHGLDGQPDGRQEPLGIIEGIPAPEQMAQALTRALDLVEAWEAPANRPT